MRRIRFVVLAALAAARVAAAGSYEKSLAIAGGGTLRLEAEAAEVTLEHQPGRSVAVRVTTRGTIGEDVLVEARESGPDAIVTVERPSRWSFAGGSGRLDTRVHVRAPRDIGLLLALAGGSLRSTLDVEGDVTAEVAGGEARLGRTGGKLEASVSGGRLELGDAGGAADLACSGGDLRAGAIGGPLTARTSGGDLAFGAVAGAVDLRASGGDARGGPVSGAIRARSSGGSLRLDVQSFGSGADITTSGGDVELAIDPEAAFEADVVASGGGVHSAGFALDADSGHGRDRLSGKVNGGGPVLSVRCSGGSVRLVRAGETVERER